MDQMTRDILTKINGGQLPWNPENNTSKAIAEFQATVKRIEWANDRGYIKGFNSIRCSFAPGIYAVQVDGLTLLGEQALLEDPDESDA